MSEGDARQPVFWTRRECRVLALGVLIAVGLIAATRGPRWPGREATDDFEYRVDPNTAPLEVLVTLPGIGPARARSIIAERERAPFRSADEIAARVSGIGPATVRMLEPYLRFDGSTEEHEAEHRAN